MEVIDSNCGDGDSEACRHPHSPLKSGISTDTCSRSSSSSQSDIVLNGLFVAATLSSSEIDLKVFDAVMNEVMSLPIFTVVHVSKSVRPLLAEVLSQEFQLSVSHGAVGFMRLFAFAKSVLRVLSRGGKKRHHNVRNAILSRLKPWKNGDLVSLCCDWLLVWMLVAIITTIAAIRLLVLQMHDMQ